MSNNIFIDLTEELANKGWTVNWEFNGGIDPALLKYNNCVTYLDCREINPDVMNDLDKNGAWNYRLDNLEVASDLIDGLFVNKDGASPITTFNVDLPKLKKPGCLFWAGLDGNANLQTIKTSLPSLIDTITEALSSEEDLMRIMLGSTILLTGDSTC